eukprot:CAMPEP_0115340790 /NCGR_PEP_ID=MMETSP0270-20121206/91330_1 /TAXON_ID=71861 /ORGANISM="Scrippsiella trochoidea, Strain CCMP3099" /LENGTH=56 /DNA_ID=CAMNT_0002762259 /DNA_START=256 /DNA_END=426 /DNA_ORIENTATION=+
MAQSDAMMAATRVLTLLPVSAGHRKSGTAVKPKGTMEKPANAARHQGKSPGANDGS